MPQDGEPQQLSGPEFGKLDDAQAAQAAARLKILSRARPMDKKRLVELLRDQQQQVVAVTGDGVNDGPALRAANVGLAMGRTGTAVAKEASDIILLDDSFRSIVNAIMWGRSLYLNIQRFIVFQLTINVTALVLALLGPFIGVALPFTVIQMLWINLIMDTFAALALATEPAQPDVLNRPPRDPQGFIVTREMLWNILPMAGVFTALLAGLLVLYVRPATGTDEYGYRLSIFFTVFVLLQFWNLFNCRCLGVVHSALSGLAQNPSFAVIAALILTGQVLIVEFGGSFFRTVPLHLHDWASILGATAVVLVGGELWRAVQRRQAPVTVGAGLPVSAD
jgi:Ca2+-transporting ATPase